MKINFPGISFLFAMTITMVSTHTRCTPGNLDPVTDLLAKKENFDTIINSNKVELFTLRNKGGIAVQLTNYGGYLVSIITPDKGGKYADVLLGYNNIKSYINDKMMQGCIVGPNVNVIDRGKFNIDGIEYQLPVKKGGNNSHSSPDGFYKEVFDAKQEGNKVTLTLKIVDMKTGFPGNRNVTAVYELLPGDTLSLEMTMTSDRKTIANMTNHAYFNLQGEGSKDILDHIIQIFADSITPYHRDHVPTGEIVQVDNTPFDLCLPTPIGKMINSDNEQIKFGKGYDHNFVLSKKPDELGIAVRLSDPHSKRVLELYTNQPGIQVYTGNYLDGSIRGRSGKPYNYRSGVALEPQKYPDTPNHKNFPSSVLEPGKVYKHKIKYVFGLDK
jgi:aldose 1-epimerase